MLPNYDYCKAEFEKYGLELSEKLYSKLDIYADFLVEYNENVNLTAITEPDEILHKHFIDSILMLKYAEIPQDSTLIDVGTGAGFPSVPVKLYREDIQLTLLDSLNKRITFLQLLCEKLDIKAAILGTVPIFIVMFLMSLVLLLLLLLRLQIPLPTLLLYL